MTTAVQHRRGTTAEHAAFTGLEGELTIDTTKDTAVIHDGTLAGGYPLAKENLANVTTSGLSSIDGASTASDDKFFIYDQSATSLKTITRAELNNAIEQDALANVAITGGTINGTTIGGTTAAAGAFTTLAASGAVTLSGATANGVVYANGSKVLTTGSALVFDGSQTFKVRQNTAGTGNYSELVLDIANTFSAGGQSYLRNISLNGGNSSTALAFGVNADGGGAPSEQMRLTSTGLGIGTSSPTRKLDVLGNAKFGTGPNPNSATLMVNNVANTATGIQLFQEGVESWIMGMPANSAALTWSASGAEQMRLTSTGLGIGTSSPDQKLTIQTATANQGVSIYNTTGAGGYGGSVTFGIQAGLSLAQHGQIYTSLTNGGPGTVAADMVFKQAISGSLTEFMRASSGNLGLGVTPSAWNTYKAIDISSSASISGVANETSIATNAYNNGGWKYKNTAAASLYSQYLNGHYWFTAPSGTAGNAISFSQVMTLDSSGNLGIGTSSPQAKVHANGAFLSSGALVALSASNIFVDQPTSALSRIGVVGANTSTYGTLTISQYSSNGSLGRDALSLDSSGNLGLGVTPSASNLATIQSSYGILSGNNQANIAANAYYNNQWNYTSTAVASLYTQTAGQHRFFTAPSGTAGDAISFSQVMTLTANGDLLVGTTSARGVGTTIYRPDTGVGRIDINKSLSGTATAMGFYYNGTSVGSIAYSDTATAYNTSSDYRLKNITGPITTSGAYIDSLNPVEGTWKADGSTFVGLIAHEVQEASRTNVATGVKDGEEMQGMDYSSAEIIANLIAEVKSLRQRLAAAGI